MATGGRPSVKDSDICYDFPCSVCSEKNRNVEAIKSCEDCQEYLCGECFASHSMFRAMRDHTIIDMEDRGRSRHAARPVVPSVKCKLHDGNKIDLFCGNHDVVGCATCISLSHRLCSDVHYIPDVAKGIKNSQEPFVVKESMLTLKERAAKLKQAREQDLTRVTARKDVAVQMIDRHIQAIVKRLNELKETALSEVDSVFKRHQSSIKADIVKSVAVICKLGQNEKRLNSVQRDDEMELFILVKQGNAERKENEKDIMYLERFVRSETLEVTVDETILTSVAKVEKFVRVKFETSGISSLTFHNTLCVRMSDDTKGCSISSCSLLQDGSLIMTDANNKCVKLFNKFYAPLDHCAVPSSPTASCLLEYVGVSVVAVILSGSKTVQFAKVDRKIHLTQSFPIGEHARGISYSSSRLFITCVGERSTDEGPCRVKIFDLGGKLLKTLSTPGDDEYTCSIHMPIITTVGGGFIVANFKKGLLALDKNGKEMWHAQSWNILHAVTICEIDDGSVLICSLFNRSVSVVSQRDQKSRTLLPGNDRWNELTSLTFDRCQRELIITEKDCEFAMVYRLNEY